MSALEVPSKPFRCKVHAPWPRIMMLDVMRVKSTSTPQGWVAQQHTGHLGGKVVRPAADIVVALLRAELPQPALARVAVELVRPLRPCGGRPLLMHRKLVGPCSARRRCRPLFHLRARVSSHLDNYASPDGAAIAVAVAGYGITHCLPCRKRCKASAMIAQVGPSRSPIEPCACSRQCRLQHCALDCQDNDAFKQAVCSPGCLR